MVRKLNNFDEWIDYFRYWQDGIGPRDQRPPRLEMAWGTIESNRFVQDPANLKILADPRFYLGKQGCFVRGTGCACDPGKRGGGPPAVPQIGGCLSHHRRSLCGTRPSTARVAVLGIQISGDQAPQARGWAPLLSAGRR